MHADQPSGIFYAKVMLFGEYSLLAGSKAITIPWPTYHGALRYGSIPGKNQQLHAKKSHATLRQFAAFLAGDALSGLNRATRTDETHTTGTSQKGMNKRKRFPFSRLKQFYSNESYGQPDSIALCLDLDRLISDLEAGLFFDSDIPTGYGLGSSGALVAAVFDCYATHPITPGQNMCPREMKHLKHCLSAMENFFHTTSSGIDPLSCFIGRPLLVHHDEVVVAELPDYPTGFPGGFFLLDTGLPRHTATLMEIFHNKYKQLWFNDFMQNVYTPAVDTAVDFLIEGDLGGVSEVSCMLSHYQLMHFKEMIPAAYLPLWEKGIQSNAYTLKLCGAGGGGYLLGFTNDYAVAEEALLPCKPIPIYLNPPNP